MCRRMHGCREGERVDGAGHFVAVSQVQVPLLDPDLCCELEVCKQHFSFAGRLPIRVRQCRL